MKEIMLMVREKVMEFIHIKININIAGIGKKMKKVVKEFLSLKKKEDMKAILRMENVMVLVHSFIQMVMFIKVNGKIVKKMVKVYILL